jgi:hypothetical protein
MDIRFLATSASTLTKRDGRRMTDVTGNNAFNRSIYVFVYLLVI